MSKRLISCLLSVVFLVCSAAAASAKSTGVLKELSQCKRVYAYSGRDKAYFYGFRNQTLCSARLIPDVVTRTVDVNGSIISACHDDDNAYALYKTARQEYCIMRMNMNSGDCVWFCIAQGKTVQPGSFAACGEEAMVITVTGSGSQVWGQNGNKSYVYTFPAHVKELFVNDNRAYALTNDGSLYRIGGGSKAFCANLGGFSNFSNAGCGWMFTIDRALVSVGGSVEYTRAKTALKLNGQTVTDGNARLLAGAGTLTAALKEDYSCEINGAKRDGDSSPTEHAEEDKSVMKSGGISAFDAGMTVSELKSSYSNVSAVYGADGEEIKSGALRTGYTAKLDSGTCLIAVSGDLNGSGTVNSADVNTLMGFFTGSENLSGCQNAAADFNRDGMTDNRDLVLISRVKK